MKYLRKLKRKFSLKSRLFNYFFYTFPLLPPFSLLVFNIIRGSFNRIQQDLFIHLFLLFLYSFSSFFFFEISVQNAANLKGRVKNNKFLAKLKFTKKIEGKEIKDEVKIIPFKPFINFVPENNCRFDINSCPYYES